MYTTIPIASQKRKERTKETESGYKTKSCSKTEEMIVETSIKKRQQLIKTIQRAAGIKNYENRLKDRKDLKACC